MNVLQGQAMSKGKNYQGALVDRPKEIGIRSFIDLIIRNLTHLSEGSGRQHNLSFYENLHNSKQLEKLYTELIPLSF